jgi:hypothetical protein
MVLRTALAWVQFRRALDEHTAGADMTRREQTLPELMTT